MTENILIPHHPEEQISKFLSLIGQPTRIQILLIIGAQEACVCHLEAVLGLRQASISQHLMVLRKAGLVTSRRVGRNIFYGISNPEVTAVLHHSAQLAGFAPETFKTLTARPVSGCACPDCNPDLDPDLTCKKFKSTRIS